MTAKVKRPEYEYEENVEPIAGFKIYCPNCKKEIHITAFSIEVKKAKLKT